MSFAIVQFLVELMRAAVSLLSQNGDLIGCVSAQLRAVLNCQMSDLMNRRKPFSYVFCIDCWAAQNTHNRGAGLRPNLPDMKINDRRVIPPEKSTHQK
ncbi:hypothetical protein I5S76_27210 [Pseudomonas gessardii]|nr:hypothetical protein [Pseudomonas gessardii]